MQRSGEAMIVTLREYTVHLTDLMYSRWSNSLQHQKHKLNQNHIDIMQDQGVDPSMLIRL